MQVGDYTIVHVGFALSKIDEASAQQTLTTFAQLGLLEEELDELKSTDLPSSKANYVKYLTEYRDADQAMRLVDEIRRITTRPWAIMEVCGGQTHSIIRNGLDQLLPEQIEMIHGPGCPVCVTPIETIDRALSIAAQPNVIFCSYGDMLRVPGSKQDLFQVKAAGGDVRVVYSPLDALNLARKHPDHQVVFLAIGFETTAQPTP